MNATPNDDRDRMAHFHSLSFEAQAGAIRRLAATGMSLQGISHATGIAVEQLRRVIGSDIETNPMQPAVKPPFFFR